MTSQGPAYLRFRMLPGASEEEKKAIRKARREAEKKNKADAEARRIERRNLMVEACMKEHKLTSPCSICKTRCQRNLIAQEERARRDRKKKARLALEIGRNPDIAATPTTTGVIVDSDGEKAEVRVADTSPIGLASRLSLPAQHKAAVQRLQRDFEVSEWNARAASFEMAVDGSSNPAMATHLHVVEARERIKAVAYAVGRDWPLVRVTMLPPYTPLSTVSRRAGVDYRECRDRLGLALDALAEFYTPGRLAPCRVLRECVQIVEAAAREIA